MTVLQGDGLTAVAAAPEAAPARPAKGRRWLFNPVVDVLGLGGASLLALPLIWLLVPATAEAQRQVAILAIAMTHFINHPHFANSYQIFYGGFAAKAFGREGDALLRWRYRFAGIVVPLALGGFLAGCVLAGDARTLGFAGNLMFLLVGWHYAKQGYGMAIVDSVLKRRFYDAGQKRALLWNAYACWSLSWLTGNRSVAQQDLWGLKYYTFSIPDWLYYAAVGVTAASGLWLLLVLGRRFFAGKGMAWTGIMAYAITLYLWLIFVRLDARFLLVVPAFHSLQYLVVVWRYKLNEAAARPARAGEGRFGGLTAYAWLRLALFLAVGVLVGWALFWGLPQWLNKVVDYDRAIFGPALFLFAFWIFVNVHHYFLDNVMWRRDNALTKRFLFGQG